MDEKIKKEIIKQTQSKLCACEDYNEFQMKYNVAIKKIKEQSILIKLKRIEKLLDKKSQLEIIHVYNQAHQKAKEIKDFNITDSLLFNGVDQAARLSELYKSSLTYRINEKNLITMKNELYYSVHGTSLESAIDDIYEVYSNCNYEIIRAGIYIGYFTDIHLFLGNDRDISTLHISKNIIGKKMRYCRKCAKLTQEQTAKIFQIRRSTVSRYECGSLIPSIELLYKYSIYYNINIVDFIDDTMSLDTFIEYYSNKIIQLPKAI